jgi:RNA polymerase sigma-70 factor (ECF subfamily)
MVDPVSGARLSELGQGEWKTLAAAARAQARKHLRDDEALDVAQDVMAALWIMVNSPPANVEAWVVHTAMCRAIDVARHKAVQRSVRPELERCAAGEILHDDYAPVIAKMVVAGLLAKIPDGARRTVELRYLEDLDREEIACKLGVSVNTVKTHLTRGITAMRRELGISVQKPER